MAMRFRINRRILAGLSAIVLFGFPPQARSYSVLTHEAIIDTLWLVSILPVLTKRFPRQPKSNSGRPMLTLMASASFRTCKDSVSVSRKLFLESHSN